MRFKFELQSFKSGTSKLTQISAKILNYKVKQLKFTQCLIAAYEFILLLKRITFFLKYNVYKHTEPDFW